MSSQFRADPVLLLTILSIVLTLLIGVLGTSARAAETVYPPMIAQTWTCSYHDGRSIDDVLKVRDAMVSEADQVGLILPPAYVWTLTSGDAHADFVWFNIHRDMGAFGASVDAWQASGLGPALLERFSSVSDCAAGISAAQMIFPRGNPGASVPDGPVFIASQRCSFLDATSNEQLRELISQMHDVMKGMGDHAPAFATALFPPSQRASGESDVLIYSGHGSAVGRRNYAAELLNTDAGQRLRKRQKAVLDCGDLTLWSSQQVVEVDQ